ncbi:MAG: hypothetical protein LIP28_01405 [Deltaproteobacteria bacterium]|nr:hypothetical protein [Deltaproteobacteria bacterium]
MTRSPLTALFLAEDESCLTLDRKVLRRLGVTQARFFASGRKALDCLGILASAASRAANGPDTPAGSVDILICNERLSDMTGLRFLSHVRSLPGLADIPVVFLVGSAQSTVALAARASNSCAVLARPYTQDQADAALDLAVLPEARYAPLVLPPSFVDRFGPKTARTESTPILKRHDPKTPRVPGEAALREGLAALHRGDSVSADRLLHGSYQADPGRIETCLALSKLFAFLHKEKEELAWLCKAGVLCFKRGDATRAKSILAQLPRGKAGQTPLLAEAGLALQEGEAKAAALSFLEAHKLDPSQPLHALIGRTCMFTPAPEEHMRDLIQALSRAGHGATAGKLHWRLLQPAKAEEEYRPGFLDNFPLLQDIVSVATHTFKTWRHAA